MLGLPWWDGWAAVGVGLESWGTLCFGCLGRMAGAGVCTSGTVWWDS